MFGIAAIVAFAIALIFQLTGSGSGHLNAETFVIAGLLCLAVHLVYPWQPWARRAS